MRGGPLGTGRRAVLRVALATCIAGFIEVPALAAAGVSAAYDLSVWVDALFGPDGGLRQYSFVDEARYPGPFLDRLRERLAQARIRPVVEQGRPVTFQTGVRLSVQVTPTGAGGTVTLRGLSVEPLVLKTYAASYPRDIGATPGWNGRVTAICTVAVDGHCRTVATRAVPGIPESVRRFAIVSMEGWRFRPQEVDGVAVEGETVVEFDLTTEDAMPEDFRVPKFDRLEKIR